jgi:AAA ATPase domain
VPARTALFEREELLEALDAARCEAGGSCSSAAKRGVGKTALVRAFGAGVSTRVLWGSCESLATPTPLGPIVDIAAQVEGALADRLAEGAAPRDVGRALLAELERPTLVVLEDVHWADEATLDALRVIGRRVDWTESLVLATYRDDEMLGDHPLRVVLGELATAPGVSRMSVPRLSLGAVRGLAEPHGADGDAIHRLTNGNAFYVTEVVAAGGGALPETVRDAVLSRASTLTPDARRVLDVVAVVPARTELLLLDAVAGREVAALDECLAAGVLREDGDTVSFRHELARLAVESAVPLARRRRLHATVLEALASPRAGERDPARLAHHAEEAGDGAAGPSVRACCRRSGGDAWSSPRGGRAIRPRVASRGFSPGRRASRAAERIRSRGRADGASDRFDRGPERGGHALRLAP